MHMWFHVQLEQKIFDGIYSLHMCCSFYCYFLTENQNENTTMEKPQVTEDNSDSKQNFFSNFSSIVGKVANNATTVIKDKVNTSMIAEFNKEQEDFIKNKGM